MSGFGAFTMGILVGAGATAYFFFSSGGGGSSEKKKGFLETLKQRGGAYAAASNMERTGSFLTDLLAALWKHFDVAVSREIVACCEPMFKDMLPGPLASLKFTKCSLGRVPLRLDNAVVHSCAKTSTGKDYIKMEVDAVWDGDCDIQLKADYLGKFGVKSMKLAGRMSFIFQPIVYDVSLIGAIQYGFINVPDLDLEFTGLANVADFSSIKTSIRQTLLDIIAGMMVLPMRMLTKMDEALPWFDMYSPPIGVARVTIVKGRGFKEEKRALRKADIPDVYGVLQVGGQKVFQTSVVKNNLAPVWNQSADFVLFDHDQILCFKFYDEDLGTMDATDDYLGTGMITVGEMLLSGKTQEIEIQDDEGRRTGAYATVHCDILPLVSDLTSIEECRKEGKEHMCGGLLTILVSQAFDVFIPEDKKDDENYCFFVKCVVGENTFFSSAVAGENPTFDCYFHVPLNSKTVEPSIMFFLFQGPSACDSEKNNCIGSFDIPFKLLANATGGTLSGRKIKVGDTDTSLEYSVSLSGVKEPEETNILDVITDNLSRSGAALSSPLTPTADSGPVVHVTIEKGWGFEVEKKRFKKDDIPDVFLNIKFGSSPTIWRTATIKDNCAPAWNETRAFRLLDHGQILQINAFDEDTGPNDVDDPLGSARVSIGKVLLAGGKFDVELQTAGKGNGCFISVKAFVEKPPEEEPEIVTAEERKTAASNTTAADTPVSKDKGGIQGFAGALDSGKRSLETNPAVPDTKTSAFPKAILVTAVQGSGFKVQKRRLRKNDIPDVFCKFKVGSSVWKTTTIRNDVEPAWNESNRFVNIQADDLISVDVYDEDKGKDPDEYLGSASIPVSKLLSSGECQLDLKADGVESGASITIRCAES